MINEKRKNRIKNVAAGYLFISPVIIGMLIFSAYPLLESFYTTFTEYHNVGSHVWVGLNNYKEVFSMPLFKKALGNTFYYAGLSIPVNLFCSYFIAYLLNSKIKGVKVFRMFIYSPCIIPTVANVIVFTDLFNPTFGWFNQVLRGLGLQAYPFMTSPSTSIPSLVIYSMWQMGAQMLIWLSAFNSVPPELYEAAEIDGANRAVKMLKITVPLITPVIFYNLVIGIIGGLQLFAEVFLMTNGGPLESTTTVVMLIYRYGLGDLDMGLASAMAWVLAAIIVCMTAVAFLSRKWWVYNEN